MNEMQKEYIEKGCPCGGNGGSNFFQFLDDYHFYCNTCRVPLMEKFIDLLGTEEYFPACERMKQYLKIHKIEETFEIGGFTHKYASREEIEKIYPSIKE